MCNSGKLIRTTPNEEFAESFDVPIYSMLDQFDRRALNNK